MLYDVLKCSRSVYPKASRGALHSAQREQGAPNSIAVPMFSTWEEVLLLCFAVLSPLHKSSDVILPATQHHQRKCRNCALPLDANVVMLCLTLTALNSLHAAYRKKFRLDIKEVVHQGKK